MMKSFAVVGRIPCEEHDTCLVLEAADATEAVIKFTDAVFEQRWDGMRQKIIEFYKEAVFISYILVSDSTIQKVINEEASFEASTVA